MGHYANEIGYKDRFADLREEEKVDTTTVVKERVAEIKAKKEKAANGLTKVFADAAEIARAWEAASPAARTLFLASIEATKKE